ncbi:hypothetical protein HO133_000157 [Letharia lupina]|uniref:Uncharacterized protein n=1 Tax=Letharia lupina TaxID=560253 RepID=A0A8H6CH77_9LECA|nr:uncharacterized protein HO133_000157 [Letharia lupina]KAF6223315.1 hypothetical protein HO133_000157 [Letharia lupina]
MTWMWTLIVLSWVFFFNACVAASLDICPLNSNDTVTTSSNITWAQAVDQPIRQLDGPSYLRPDIGGALVPWVYSIIILLVHIPVVIIRVVKWEAVQTWCLGATVFTIAITAQAFASTNFRSDKILTWTPLLLVIDAGSMAQVLFLVVEDYELLTRLRRAIMPLRVKPSEEPFLHDEEAGKSGDPDEGVFIAMRTVSPVASTTAPTSSTHPPLFTSKPLYVALISSLLLISVFALQFLGLHHAVNAARQSAPSVSWCSPIFQPFGVAVLDGNCNVWPILQTFSKGVGCILIPGNQQMAWLKATVAGTGISIALELVDIGILATVHSGTRWRGVKMRRPWFTMFSGVAVLGLILVFGVVYSTILPPGISEKVWIVMDAGAVTVYEGELGTAGLRGAMIGWNDGVFQGWGNTYFGSWAV